MVTMQEIIQGSKVEEMRVKDKGPVHLYFKTKTTTCEQESSLETVAFYQEKNPIPSQKQTICFAEPALIAALYF